MEEEGGRKGKRIDVVCGRLRVPFMAQPIGVQGATGCLLRWRAILEGALGEAMGARKIEGRLGMLVIRVAMTQG
jgi:hypothetical protein